MFDASSVFVVYVDLAGADRGALIRASHSDDAVNCIYRAWNANLLWHFKIYGDADSSTDTAVKYGELPWNVDSISKVLSAIRLKRDLDRAYESLARKQKELIERYSKKDNYRFIPMHGDVQLSSKLLLLERTYSSVKNELLDENVDISGFKEESTLEIFSYYQNIVSKISQMKAFHSRASNNWYAMSTPSFSPDEFLKSLPTLEDIFPHYKHRNELNPIRWTVRE